MSRLPSFVKRRVGAAAVRTQMAVTPRASLESGAARRHHGEVNRAKECGSGAPQISKHWKMVKDLERFIRTG